MTITWREITLPDFGPLGERPTIPASLYAARCARAYAAAGADWLIVYGDREHYANLTYLTGYDPRFEEGILLLGAGERRILLVGNEGIDYAGLLTLPLDIVLCQSLSLPGQDRSRAPRLDDVLRAAGLAAGQSLALVGWKGVESDEWAGRFPSFFAPAILVDTLRDLAGDPAALRDATPVLLHPTEGLRAITEIEQIVAFEWAAARATAAVRRIQVGVRPGMTELEAVGQMGYEGDPLSTHVLFASGTGTIVGLGSAGSRRIARGDGITTGFGYWGGLCARAGMVDDANTAFLEQLAYPYFRGLVAWYETVGVGVTGGTVFERVTSTLAEGGLRSALNPGHLTGHDEWVHSPMVAGGTGTLRSGMAFQCDVIPTPAPAGWALNCEDPVVFADEALRADLAARYPAVWSRITARQQFMRDSLGIAIGDDVLPLSTIPAYLAPLWLAPNTVLVQE
jgi:Xaa-Pro aminopeptidase